MNQFEYLIPFVGIIYALAATDLLISTHRIIIERRRIKFHVVPIIWAFVAFLLVINAWTGFFEVNKNITLENAGELFILSLLPMIIFLISALSLPHTIKDDFCMWEYYEHHKAPLFASHIIYLVLIPAVMFFVADVANIQQALRNLAFIAVFAWLIWVKHWAWHLAVGLVFMSVIILSIFKQSIS